ncbi:MAG TPA: NAD(+)/NADH kinase [Terriglobales bacterium]|nr:NAD(+)/NADH kinase [Terriglobales bacterium]
MKSAGIVSKPEKPELSKLVPELTHWLEDHGYQVYIDQETATYVPGGGEVLEREKLSSKQLNFVVVLGGDGTLLSAARAVAAAGTPILGINLGSLGFLTEVPTGEMYATLRAINENCCEVEKRSMLQCCLMRGERCASDYLALNDAVVAKSAIARLANFDLYINRAFVSNYRGDGLIISTPTGSTAYSLAAGGPILMPSVEGLVISPICPHALTHRPLVIRDSVEIEIVAKSSGEQVFLSIDGQVGMPVEDGDRIVCRRSQHVTKLLRLHKTFFDVLRTKLKWGQR